MCFRTISNDSCSIGGTFMILITGGKYQGRLKCAFDCGNYKEEDVFDFAKINSAEYASSNKNFKTCKIWYNFQEYVRSLALSGTDSWQIENMMKKLVENNNPEIIIMAEVGAGVIPMNKSDVVFREASGRLSVYFAEGANEVYRMICGIRTKLK